MSFAMGAQSWITLVVLVAACKRDDAVTVVATTTTPEVAASSAVPVDHLAPSELLEGDAKAFGLVLPRGVRIDHAFDDVVFASGQVSKEGVVKYVRSHVREGKLLQPAGTERATFDQVRIPAMPDKQFVVTIEPARGAVATTRIEVRDVTLAKAVNLPDEAARWAAAGLKPNGQPLDPAHVQ
jgi:hypothetical protein